MCGAGDSYFRVDVVAAVVRQVSNSGQWAMSVLVASPTAHPGPTRLQSVDGEDLYAKYAGALEQPSCDLVTCAVRLRG